jgi:hypothetical protein
MAEVDTSSYPRLPANPPSFLDTAQKFGALQEQQQAIQSNQLAIQQQQLGLIKQRFAAISGQIPGLISKPDLNENDVRQFYQNNVNEGLITPDQAATEIAQIPPTAGMPAAQAALTLKNHMGNKLQMAQSTMEALNYHLGQPGSVDNGQTIQPTLSSPKPGFSGNPVAGGVVGPQAGIPVQPPPTTGVVSQGGPGQPPPGTPTLLGNTGSRTGLPTAPGALPVGPAPVPPGMKIGGQNVTGINVGPDTGAGAKGPIVTGTTPLFEAGKTQYVQDQDLATQKLTAIKPALQALPLIDGIMAGPGTAAYTHALAGLKAFGIVPTGVNDPVAVRQEVVKKLNQYVSSNPVGQRSDAAQTLAEASSPTPNVQILPALKTLTQDAIALDRVQAARPGAFNSQDFSKYGAFRSTFPAQMDERAFKLDLMSPQDRNALLAQMTKNKNTFEGKKFWNSLAIIDKQGLINTGGE